jgi:hypothetical protein
MKLHSYYVTLVDFEDMGLGHGCDPSSFDDAVDAYAEHRSNGLTACVMRYDPPIGGACGVMVDVTPDADEAVRRRYRARRQYQMPDWAMEGAA